MVSPRRGRVEAASLADTAYRELKQRITELYLAPGAPITEAALVASTGVSRTPLREALARLRMEGLVMVDSSGWQVTPITIGDVRELWELRTLLEARAVSLAVHRIDTAEQLRELEALGCTASYDPADDASISAFVRGNTAFHSRLAEIGGNQRLASALRSVLEQQERIIQLAFVCGVEVEPEEWVKEHHDLLRAVMGGNQAHAAAIAVEQSKDALARIIQALKDSDQFANANISVVRDTPSA
ncbi:MAG: hypothetical protein QOK43_1838 [Acidimicrobiaceae bacterium]|nr:hypothetical protein [Acidimicrobiaceae bacterium]